ncbi:unnamed protein product [Closterium sp. NIES-65]|nr:unnamed protein product [Closterium sp. NIES-65]
MAPASKRKPLAVIDNIQSAAQGDAVPGKRDEAVWEDGEEWQQQGEQGMKGPQGQQEQQGMDGQQGIQGQQDMLGAGEKQGSRGCMAIVPVTDEPTAVALTTALNPSPLSLPPEPPPPPPHTGAALITTAQNPSPLSMLPLQPPPRPPAGSASLFQTARGKPVPLSSAAVDKACALLGVQQHERPHFDDGANLGAGSTEGSTVGAGLFQTASNKPVRLSSAAVDKACALLGVQQHERPRFDAPRITPPIHKPAALLNAQGHAGSQFNVPRIMPLTHGSSALPVAQGHERQSSHAPAAMELSVRNSAAELTVVAQPDAGAGLGRANRGEATVGAGLFQTARGKPVSVSSAAVDKACALLGVQQYKGPQFVAPHITPPTHKPAALPDAQGHERQSSHVPSPMELAVRNSEAELAVMAQPDGGARLGGASRGGATVKAGLFQTARGEPVSVSSAAVDKACALLGVQQGPPALLDAQGHERQSSHVPEGMELSVRNPGAEPAVVAQPDGGAGVGGASPGGATVRAGLFQTGRGKPVSLSSAAVDKACALLGVQQYKGPPQLESPRISEEPAVLRLKGAGAEQTSAAQADGGAGTGAATIGAGLFQTARGKPVHVSSAAVDKACALLGVQHYKGPPQLEEPRVSDEPAVLRLEGAGAEQTRAAQPDSGVSRGGATVRTTLFRTASEKPVSLSSAAVDKACALLDVQQHQRPRFEGSASLGGATVRTAGLFQTASRKPVHISSAAVDKACALFGVQQRERPQGSGSSARAEEMVASLFDLGTGGSGGGDGRNGEGSKSDGSGSGRDGGGSGRGGGGSGEGGGTGEGGGGMTWAESHLQLPHTLPHSPNHLPSVHPLPLLSPLPSTLSSSPPLLSVAPITQPFVPLQLSSPPFSLIPSTPLPIDSTTLPSHPLPPLFTALAPLSAAP